MLPGFLGRNRLLPYVEIVHADAAASVAVQEREERNALPAPPRSMLDFSGDRIEASLACCGCGCSQGADNDQQGRVYRDRIRDGGQECPHSR